jgi:ferrochelatase
VFSVHGLPKRYLAAGDPYFCQCHASARRIAAALALRPDEWVLSFQSRVGREVWLQPYTDATLTELAVAGIRRVDVICPGFAVDCLETLEEIAQQNAARFRAAGGSELHYIPALNANPEHARLLAGLLRRHLEGWADDDRSGAECAENFARYQGPQR